MLGLLRNSCKRFIRNMHIEPIPMRWGSGDNYAYILVDATTKNAWIIDPAVPKDIADHLKNANIDYELKAIVNTHHHWDHSDGNDHFHKKYPDLPLIAGKDSPLVTYTPSNNEVIDLGENLQITALYTPCHTQDSICYFVEDSKTGEKAVFTGDTLFVSGCGRFFEGEPQEMNHSLNSVLAKLPKETKVYPGHEYTKSNVKFSKTVLDNEYINKLVDYVEKNEKTTGVFTIGDELNHNPFLRLSDPQILKSTGLKDPNDIMGKLRELKNNL